MIPFLPTLVFGLDLTFLVGILATLLDGLFTNPDAFLENCGLLPRVMLFPRDAERFLTVSCGGGR